MSQDTLQKVMVVPEGDGSRSMLIFAAGSFFGSRFLNWKKISGRINFSVHTYESGFISCNRFVILHLRDCGGFYWLKKTAGFLS